MFFTLLNAELLIPQRLLNVTAGIEAGLHNSQPVITKVYREGNCHKQFYMTVIGKIIRERGWIELVK